VPSRIYSDPNRVSQPQKVETTQAPKPQVPPVVNSNPIIPLNNPQPVKSPEPPRQHTPTSEEFDLKVREKTKDYLGIIVKEFGKYSDYKFENLKIEGLDTSKILFRINLNDTEVMYLNYQNSYEDLKNSFNDVDFTCVNLKEAFTNQTKVSFIGQLVNPNDKNVKGFDPQELGPEYFTCVNIIDENNNNIDPDSYATSNNGFISGVSIEHADITSFILKKFDQFI
jgi:hypothetical protein